MRESHSTYCKRSYRKHRERRLTSNKERNKRDRAKRRDKIAACAKIYNVLPSSRARRSELAKIKRETDANYRLKRNLSCRLRLALKGAPKSSAMRGLLGCSVQRLREHLENLFQPGMTWENYGQWHVDHVVPCAEFDLRQPHQQSMCFNWSNLQPLWAADNIRKGKRISQATGAQVATEWRVLEPTAQS